MSARTVSVIIPTYNRADLLSDAIDSVLAQDYPLVEVVVVDDGSTDGTEAVARRFGDRIKYIKRKNGGPAAARNTGIAASSGEIIALLDSDDLWLPGKLRKQMPLFGTPATALVHSAVTVHDIPISKSWYDYPGDTVDFHAVMRSRGFQVPGVAFRRSLFNEIGPFDESLPYGREDIDYWLRATAKYPSRGIPEALAVYRVHGMNISRGFSSLREGVEIYRKYLGVHPKCRECQEAFATMLRQGRRLQYDGLCRASSEELAAGHYRSAARLRIAAVATAPALACTRFASGVLRRFMREHPAEPEKECK